MTTEFTLSIFEPNSLLPHRAGIAGLALALSEINLDHSPVAWEINDDEVILSWDILDRDAVKFLLSNTYILQDGYLDVPAMKLDQQGKYAFTQGVTTTFLQHNQQRKLGDTLTKSFLIEDGQPEISISYKPITSCYYLGDLKEAFSPKTGAFKGAISLKGHHLPGLEECFVNGTYKETPQGYLALLFLPLACGYYELPGRRSALVIPEVIHLKQWLKQRLQLSQKVAQKLSKQDEKLLQRSYQNYQSSGAAEAALYFLLQERILEDALSSRVQYCEVYQLGKQAWNKQSYPKQAVCRVNVNDGILSLYRSAYYLFPSKIRKKKDGGYWLATSTVLPWISQNLIQQHPWHAGFFEFWKANELYERKGLIKMTQYLNDDEQILFDAVQGAFRIFLRGQNQQAQNQGRPLDYSQVTDKVIYRLQRPSTQQEFATALVDFLSQYRSKAAKGSGPQIFQWLHREANWKQARDLSLLAVATYQGKGSDGEDDKTQEDMEPAEINV
ncbi:MAG: type I-MYXAN CRISPR-associated Cas8a1/Cmx1 [Cyanobacteria bacterium P01_G01_bin.38]